MTVNVQVYEVFVCCRLVNAKAELVRLRSQAGKKRTNVDIDDTTEGYIRNSVRYCREFLLVIGSHQNDQSWTQPVRLLL